MASIDTFSGSHSVNFGAITSPETRTGQENGTKVVVPESDTTAADPLGGSSRLFQLLTRLEKMLRERYAFDVFAKNSVNFGILVTYRQTWVPENYQVGDLVSTIPLAPKEIRRYTTRKVTKKTRATKELRGPATDAADRVERHGPRRVPDRREGAGEDELQRHGEGVDRREGRVAGRVDAELRRRAGQGIGARRSGSFARTS